MESDVILPQRGTPLNNGYYHNKRLGVFYGEAFPWIHSSVYGWCYMPWGEEDLIFISGEDVKVNAAESVDISGWYKIGEIKLIVMSEASGPDKYWAQELYSFEEDRTIEVNLGLVRV